MEKESVPDCWRSLLCPWTATTFSVEEGGFAFQGAEGHTASCIDDKVYIYGGINEELGYLDTMFILDLRKQQWTKHSGKIKGPSPRAFHACSAVGKDLYIHGGVNRHQVFSDIIIFHTDDLTWDTLELPEHTPIEPPALFFHTSTFFDNQLVIWGGTGPLSYSDRLCICDLQTGEWSEVRKVEETQEWPAPRANHTATHVPGTNNLFIIGGFSMEAQQKKTYYEDIYVLDMKKMSWRKTFVTIAPQQLIEDGKAVWTGRSGHTATFFNFAFGQRSVICIFGGRTMLSDTCFSVNELWTLGTENLLLSYHPVCQNENSQLPKFTVPACGKQQYLFHGAALAVPLPRRNHTATKWGTKLIIIGGWSGKERYGTDLKDVKELETNFISHQPSTYAQDMRQGMLALLYNKNFSDLLLIAEDGEQFHVNKAIVACRCPKLACCIRSGMRESNGEIKVSYRSPVLRALIEYCYLDEIEISPEVSVELLQAADEFVLDHLKRKCEDVIVPAIDTSNAVHLLVNADCYRAIRLRSAVIHFILSNWEQLECKLTELSPAICSELRMMREN